MGGKAAAVLGLVTGIVAGAVLVGAILALAPVPGRPVPSPEPSAALPATPEPSPSAVVSPSAAPSPSGSAGPAPSGSPSASGAPSPSVDPSASASAEAFGIGEPAPALVVPKLGGGTVDLAKLKGKPVWINFMATWCPSCQDELPLMQGYAARYAEQGLTVVLVDVREDSGAVKAFVEGLGVTLPVGLDGDGAAQADWGAFALPVHYWIDADGIVREAALGGIGPDVMAQGLQSIMPGVTVTP